MTTEQAVASIIVGGLMILAIGGYIAFRHLSSEIDKMGHGD